MAEIFLFLYQSVLSAIIISPFSFINSPLNIDSPISHKKKGEPMVLLFFDEQILILLVLVAKS